MDNTRFQYRHLLLSNTSTTEKFTNPQGGRSKGPRIPVRDRQAHQKFLLEQLKTADSEFQKLIKERKAVGVDEKVGITLTFESEPDFDLNF